MKDFFKKYRLEVISAAIFIVAILFACIYHFEIPQKDDVRTNITEKALVRQRKNKKSVSSDKAKKSEEEAKKESIAETTPPEVIQEDTISTDEEASNVNPEENIRQSDVCSLMVNCGTILNNIDKLKAGKENIVPRDGVVLSVSTAEFNDGETAFDVLVRELEKSNIDIKYSKTPFAPGCYIESIGGLGEFDCGSTSGWIYKVNGEALNVSASEYVLKKDDKIEFLYTCKMGDV